MGPISFISCPPIHSNQEINVHKPRTPYSDRLAVTLAFQHPSMTEQAHKAECDINRIMAKYQKTGLLTHGARYAPEYGDYQPIDFQQAMETIRAGEEMFSTLPSSARKRFNNDPATFMAFIHDEDNADEIRRLGLASPAPLPNKTGDDTTDQVDPPSPS